MHNRKLAILEGKLRIQHNHSDWYTLNAGEQTEFKGGWVTRSEGQVVDFNVIYKDCFTVEVESMPEINLIDLNTSNVLVGIYCVKGSLQIDNILLNVGDFIQVNGFVKHIESSKYSSTKDNIWHVFINDIKLKKTSEYIIVYKCLYCENKYTSFFKLKNHIISSHDNIIFEYDSFFLY
jgi:hypothetical protein